ncbi:MAG: hypothetical protein V1908_03500 [Candidatus Peregrinibacteria bacterium]
MISKRETLFSLYHRFPYFTKESLRVSANRFELSENSLNAYIDLGLRSGQIISLKRSYYVTREFYETHKTETSYLFFLANALVKSSYVSLETALQYYGLFAEAVPYAVSSVTTGLPMHFKNRLGLYAYRNITEKLFTDFKIEKKEFEFVIALPHKAIFDYLYYYTRCFTKNVHPDILEDLRIDTDELPLSDKKKLLKLIVPFTSIIIRV